MGDQRKKAKLSGKAKKAAIKASREAKQAKKMARRAEMTPEPDINRD
ncbi:hypothetical protein GCM10010106_02590 [Thermopolyspora flexuosa]|jgi:hypothetical protein|uniref:Uncharacterized protein n=1 Tax=Thermopolyspora flexuosa TaxID=103836 RepID=A0A543IYA7_9ACTN|nr:hypothetical protein [Thermopolyspora flexuosa]TQM75556.1 hypothetical protein FHX40_2268 [Thermopolyspora flexuosa]GGM60323.1 hypothetical protein GCM10010106_02590 [Thermopolyspora flexuosa]